MLRDGRLGPDDMPYLRTAKMELLDPTGALDLVDHGGASLETVGGLDGLKEWIALRGRAEGSERARALGIDPPRGLLLTGIPGCGKSLVARSLAATWDRPLLLLDPARLYGRFVGESEQRLEQSLRVAEAMAPAVLWIDEVEKGFATGSADGGVSTRLLGTFLRWLQERPDGIFVAATASDVSALPPRTAPQGPLRRDLLRGPASPTKPGAPFFFHHLRSRGHDPGALDLDKLVEVTSGFSGAEIEAVVRRLAVPGVCGRCRAVLGRPRRRGLRHRSAIDFAGRGCCSIASVGERPGPPRLSVLLAHSVGQNCSSSVDPLRASVEADPPLITVATSSK